MQISAISSTAYHKKRIRTSTEYYNLYCPDSADTQSLLHLREDSDARSKETPFCDLDSLQA